jgi:CO/xanthine dehydrogenase FAD-binding subunit
LKRYEYHKPGTIKEAIELMGTLDGAQYIAGGTDVMVLLRQKKIAPNNLISLRNISGLSYIDKKKGLRIGSGTTHGEIENNDFIQIHYTALYDATSNLGSIQIRNVATIGGNICNAAPSADTACPLLVLDANVAILGQKGEREVAIDDFFLGPGKTVLEKGELVKEFAMPLFGDNTGSAYIKHTRRKAMDLPILGVGARITISIGKSGGEVRCKDMLCTIESISNVLARFEDEELKCEDVRIAMGVVAPRPIRAKKAEEALKGKVISEKLFEKVSEIAANEASPRDSVRGEAWYRREMIKVLVKRAIMRSIDRIIRPDDTVYPERLW